VDWCAINGGDYGTQRVIVVLAAEFLKKSVSGAVGVDYETYHCDVHEFFHCLCSVLGLIS
jgi:hypothetical protein